MAKSREKKTRRKNTFPGADECVILSEYRMNIEV